MRAVIILLLAGLLVWLSLRAFRTVRADEPELAQPPAGYLIPPEAEPSGGTGASVPEPERTRTSSPEARSGGSGTHPAPMQEAPAEVAAPTPVRQPEPEPEGRTPAAVLPIESEIARRLLADPDSVPAFLDGAGSELSVARRELALALVDFVSGRGIEAKRRTSELREGAQLGALESRLLDRLVSGAPAGSPSIPVGISPVLAAGELARVAASGSHALAGGRFEEASRAYGEVIQAALDLDWSVGKAVLQAWSDALARSQTGYHWNRDADWPAVTETVRSGDSLISVRKRAIEAHPELLVCTGQIERANGLRGGMIHPGDVLKIPTGRASVLVDLGDHWALYRLGDEVVAAWEIGIGKPGSETPPGEYTVGEKTPQPMWFRPGHDPVPYGDPENPLGSRWIAWMSPTGSGTGLGFHGTRDPDSIGEDLSQGCVRMRKEAIEELFEILPRGARITVRP